MDSQRRSAVAKDDVQIDGQTQAWLASIEPDVRPRVLQETFPRILNQMAALWERPAQMDRYFADLLLDVRGNRHGFPLQVILELSALKEYYWTKVFPREHIIDPVQDPRRNR